MTSLDRSRPEQPLRPHERSTYGDRGYRTYPKLTDAVRLAIRLCRNGTDSLADLFRKVPAEYVEDGTVSCRCGGKVTPQRDRVVFCEGDGCHRVFVVGDDGVWAARLPQEET